MHETGLVRDLLRRLAGTAAANGAVRVQSVTVRLGALCSFSASHFREHFDDESIGTPAEGAQLVIIESRDETDPAALDVLLESAEFEV